MMDAETTITTSRQNDFGVGDIIYTSACGIAGRFEVVGVETQTLTIRPWPWWYGFWLLLKSWWRESKPD